jgi:hypothetical protein
MSLNASTAPMSVNGGVRGMRRQSTVTARVTDKTI